MPFRVIFRKAEMEHPVGYSLFLACMAVLVCMMTAVIISVQASNRAVRKSERQQCESVQSDVDAYRAIPPIADAGKNQLKTKERLLAKWGCPK